MNPLRKSWKFLRSYFIYGLLIILPITATLFILFVLLDFITAPIINVFGERFSSILALLISLFTITTIGFFSRHFIGEFLIDLFESFISKLPLINKIYESIKQIIVSFSLRKKNALKPVLLEYPRKGLWALGFLTSSSTQLLGDNLDDILPNDALSVFVPTTPNPTSGYMVFASKNDIKPLSISFDKAVKLLVSAGFISPN
ncbi:hypothetical protein DID78_04195 [Candidatus Marinamargulisbacteria bacterium SCGC AG-343-D04]|nr:hypothetical protein DID78_04195 [Candidatus Marinamargulisbacteria bacterium SCGC AG-343-D04]